MEENNGKVLIHFNTNEISVYSLQHGELKSLCKESADFNRGCVDEALLKEIGQILCDLEERFGAINNEITRVYATGVFQQFLSAEKTKLVIRIYVDFGIYFNIIEPELEEFYVQTSLSRGGNSDVVEGLVYQEFRKVVICGSFQEHLEDIGNIMDRLQSRNVIVLSPWTTKVIPETLGTDFILLEGQKPLKNKRDAWSHKYEHMTKFRQSDAIIVCNPDGVVGQGTMFEFGFMIAFSKRIILTNAPKELSITFPYEIGLNF